MYTCWHNSFIDDKRKVSLFGLYIWSIERASFSSLLKKLELGKAGSFTASIDI